MALRRHHVASRSDHCASRPRNVRAAAHPTQKRSAGSVRPPMGRFVLPRGDGPAPRYVALSGGSGITPVISILKTVLQTRPQSRFTLLYGNRDSASIMFLEELAGLKNRYLDRLEVYHFL